MVKITSSISLFSHFQKGSFGEAAYAYVWVFTADWIIDYQVNVGGMEAISHSVKNAREYAEMTKKEKKNHVQNEEGKEGQTNILLICQFCHFMWR